MYRSQPKAEFIRVLGIISRILRLEVSVSNVYVPNQFLLVEMTVNSKEENS
jgi:hypothetical protein